MRKIGKLKAKVLEVLDKLILDLLPLKPVPVRVRSNNRGQQNSRSRR